MFFHGKAPGLRNGGAEVVLHVREILVQEGAGRVAAGQHMEQDQGVVGWPDLEDAADDKAPRIHAAALRVLAQQQPPDQEAAQREEQVDPFAPEVLERILDQGDPLAAGADRVEVHSHHGNDGQPANKIEFDGPAGRVDVAACLVIHAVLLTGCRTGS